MAEFVNYIYGTDTQILALQEGDELFIERAFYYPSDKNYFYQLINGVLKKYGDGDVDSIGVGITLNNKVIGGVKSVIEDEEELDIPAHYEYNVHNLQVDGTINNEGIINIF